MSKLTVTWEMKGSELQRLFPKKELKIGFDIDVGKVTSETIEKTVCMFRQNLIRSIEIEQEHVIN